MLHDGSKIQKILWIWIRKNELNVGYLGIKNKYIFTKEYRKFTAGRLTCVF